MKNVYIGAVILVVALGVYFWVTEKGSFESEQIMCTADAMLCPDGSYVGRTGPNCEFAECPTVEVETSPSGEVKVGDTRLVNGLQITLHKVVEDSRCPTDAVCIWAGRLVVNVTLKFGRATETLNLGTDQGPHNFDIFKVSVLSGTPKPVSTRPIGAGDYTVIFNVEK